MIPKVDLATSSLAADPGRQRERDLQKAAHEFEAQLISFLVKGMRKAYLDEEDGVNGQYSDFADSALAGYLAGDGSAGSGLHLTKGVVERVHALEGKTTGAPAATPAPATGRTSRSSHSAPAAHSTGAARTSGGVPTTHAAHTTPAVHTTPVAHGIHAAAAASSAPNESIAEAASAAPPVNSPFGKRTDPITHDHRFHHGIDLSAHRGDPVSAAGDGVVTEAGEVPGLGRRVVVTHAGGYETVYAHLDRISVTPGEKVSAGEDLGKAGATGRATGPHLHFEVRRDGQAIDPVAIVGRARPDWVWPVAARSTGVLNAAG